MESRQDAIANYLNGLGSSADPTRAAHPEQGKRLNRRELDTLYLENDLARRIVDEIVEDAVRGGWDVLTADGDNPVREPAHLDIEDAILEAGKTGRLYGGAFVFPATPNESFDLEAPEGPIDVKNLVVLDRWEATPSEWGASLTSERFDEPVIYAASPNARGAKDPPTSVDIHYSWLLEFGGLSVPGHIEDQLNGFDDSVLQPVWDVLRNFCQTENAIANIVQRFETATISIENLSDVADDEEGLELIRKRMRLLQRSMSMVNAAIIDKDAGEEYTRKFASVNGLDTIWDRLAHSVAKAAKMPMTQLFGMSPSGLATDDKSGRANWRKQVRAYQNDYLRPALQRYYRMLTGVDVKIKFNPLDEATAKEEAEIAQTRAKARAMAYDRGVIRDMEWRRKLVEEGVIEEAEFAPTNADRTDVYEGPRDPDVPDHVPAAKRPQWVETWNEVYDDTESEERAFRAANAAINEDDST